MSYYPELELRLSLLNESIKELHTQLKTLQGEVKTLKESKKEVEKKPFIPTACGGYTFG